MRGGVAPCVTSDAEQPGDHAGFALATLAAAAADTGLFFLVRLGAGLAALAAAAVPGAAVRRITVATAERGRCGSGDTGGGGGLDAKVGASVTQIRIVHVSK